MKEVRIINKENEHYGKQGLAVAYETGVMCYFDGNADYKVFWRTDIEVVGNPTVYDATRLAYALTGATEFKVLDLVSRTRSILEREFVMDGTILRRLRELRDDGKLNYEIADNHKSIYRKL